MTRPPKVDLVVYVTVLQLCGVSNRIMIGLCCGLIAAECSVFLYIALSFMLCYVYVAVSKAEFFIIISLTIYVMLQLQRMAGRVPTFPRYIEDGQIFAVPEQLCHWLHEGRLHSAYCCVS